MRLEYNGRDCRIQIGAAALPTASYPWRLPCGGRGCHLASRRDALGCDCGLVAWARSARRRVLDGRGADCGCGGACVCRRGTLLFARAAGHHRPLSLSCRLLAWRLTGDRGRRRVC